ncbi:MAG: carbohydrate ABC transporter permease [Anaerolineae bacterium]|nr:carbohydrate ABC transporter permease [Anaerolineae bacterium]
MSVEALALRRSRSGARTAKRVVAPLRHLLLSGVALIWVIPFLWLIITSLKPLEQVFTRPPKWIPEPILWRNYIDALNNPGFNFGRLLRNSMLYSGLSTVGTAISCSLVAYGFARMRFWGRDVWFVVLLATMMIPGVVTMIPTYVLFRVLGWVGGYAPLIVPAFFGSAFYIFLLRQFFLSLPWELTESARVDGAGELRTFGSIMLPLIRPALMVAVVFNFLGTWNDFMGPLIYLSDNSKFPLSLGLYAFQTKYQRDWHLMMAASLVVTIPMMILFFAAQRQFIEGITITGMKA